MAARVQVLLCHDCFVDQDKLVCYSLCACHDIAGGGTALPNRCTCSYGTVSQRHRSACLGLQILLDGALRCPLGGTDCLSADFTWRQLVPDFAALVRSVSVALEAWPQDVLEREPNQLTTLGLQQNVCPSLPFAQPRAQKSRSVGLLLGRGPRGEAPTPDLVTCQATCTPLC